MLAFNETAELLFPIRMPCLIPPADWTGPFDGGYYIPEVRGKTPLIKARERKGHRARRVPIEQAEMPGVLAAINAMQRTAWSVNTRVLEVMREVWNKNLGIGMPPSQPYAVPPCPLPGDVRPKSLPKDSPEYERFVLWKNTARTIHNMEATRLSADTVR